MGEELPCTVRFEGKTGKGKALFESKEILFRGDFRLKIPFASIQKLEVINGDLSVRTKEGLAVFALGLKAEQWRLKILHPKSLVEKLGVNSGETSAVLGSLPAEFLEELTGHGGKLAKGKAGATAQWIFLAAESPADLDKLKAIRKSMAPATGVWVVYPKGVKSITENDVHAAGLKAGLVDVKVAGFSETHTALKFVIPKNNR